MKKIFFILTLLMSLVGTKALAYDIAVANDDGVTIYYNFINNAELEVTYKELFYISYSGSVVIPEEVTYMKKSLKVTSIGEQAFKDCRGLTSVMIPNSVWSIGQGAFSGCNGLTNITIPNSVSDIGQGAFSGCSGLTKITIPNSVTNIGGYAFSDCRELSSITIPSNVTSIGGSAFEGTVWYNNLPEGLVYVGKVAYKYKGTMPNNTHIQIKDGTVGIADHSFYNCSGLTSITIPNSVTSIGSYAFEGTGWYNGQPDGLVYAGNVAYKYKGAMPDNTSINIKDGTVEIAAGAFNGCSNLTSVTIPGSVTSIGDRGFDGCTGLTSVTIPNNVTIVGDCAFEGCI